MLELNKVLVVGRLTRDPEVRYLQSGVSVANFDIAINRSRKDSQTGEYVEEAVFIQVAAWRYLAEFSEKYLKRGSGVYVEGSLKQDKWEKDGQKHSRITITADKIKFAETRAEQEARATKGGYSSAPPSDAGNSYSNNAGSDPVESAPPPPSATPDAPASTDDDLPF